jgi:hypothetical protein
MGKRQREADVFVPMGTVNLPLDAYKRKNQQ